MNKIKLKKDIVFLRSLKFFKFGNKFGNKTKEKSLKETRVVVVSKRSDQEKKEAADDITRFYLSKKKNKKTKQNVSEETKIYCENNDPEKIIDNQKLKHFCKDIYKKYKQYNNKFSRNLITRNIDSIINDNHDNFHNKICKLYRNKDNITVNINGNIKNIKDYCNDFK